MPNLPPSRNRNHPDFSKAYKEHTKTESQESLFGQYIQDIVYGGNDGIVTTFAVVSGAIGANLGVKVVIILGIANMVADGISMGLSNYLSIKSEIDHYNKEEKREYREIEEEPEFEREEVKDIYRKKGFSGAILEQIVAIITKDKKRWVDTMMKEELNLFTDRNQKPAFNGLITFTAFCIFGVIPLTPFIFSIKAEYQFISSIIGTVLALTCLGLLRLKVTRERGILGVFEIISVGSICAFVAYIIGALLKNVG